MSFLDKIFESNPDVNKSIGAVPSTAITGANTFNGVNNQSAAVYDTPDMPDNTDDLISIEQIYEKGELTDTSKSIFKIDEIKNALSKDLPLHEKKNSVLSLIPVSGLNLEDLMLDGQKRQDLLTQVTNAVTETTNSEITNMESQIADFEAKVDQLKNDILAKKAWLDKETVLINSEQTKISTIINFINAE